MRPLRPQPVHILWKSCRSRQQERFRTMPITAANRYRDEGYGDWTASAAPRGDMRNALARNILQRRQRILFFLLKMRVFFWKTPGKILGKVADSPAVRHHSRRWKTEGQAAVQRGGPAVDEVLQISGKPHALVHDHSPGKESRGTSTMAYGETCGQRVPAIKGTLHKRKLWGVAGYALFPGIHQDYCYEYWIDPDSIPIQNVPIRATRG